MALRTIPKVNNIFSQITRPFSGQAKLVNVELNEKTGVATVTLQRPPVNSLNLDLLTELNNTIKELGKNKSRGVILTSSSNSVFSAGLDILEMYQPKLERVSTFWTSLQDLWITLYGSNFPTAAVINGHSPAGGCLLAMSCEYRIMLPNFTIGLNETQLGIAAPTWFVDTMRNTIGHRQSELALTQGRLFKTDEALKIGLVDEVANTKEEGLQLAESFIGKFARIPPIPRAVTKQSVRGDTIKRMIDGREADLKYFLSFIQNDLVQKSLGMYLEGLKQKSAK